MMSVQKQAPGEKGPLCILRLAEANCLALSPGSPPAAIAPVWIHLY